MHFAQLSNTTYGLWFVVILHMVYRLVLSFSWETCNTHEKLETLVMQNVGRLARCIMGNVKFLNVYKDFNMV